MRVMHRFFVAVLILSLVACSQVDYSYMKEGQPVAEAIVRDVGATWDADKLIARMDPRVIQRFSESAVRKMIQSSAETLGPVTDQKTLTGEVMIETEIPGKTALYVIETKFEKGRGRIKIKLQKAGSTWNVMGFWVQGNPGAA